MPFKTKKSYPIVAAIDRPGSRAKQMSSSRVDPKMNGSKALAIDTDFLGDFDDETNYHGVFGNITGFCYSIHSSSKEADNAAQYLNQIKSERPRNKGGRLPFSPRR
jgi:hypothetical protein